MKSLKYEPTDSYFYLIRQLAKCMMRTDTLNWHEYGGYTKMTALSLTGNATDKDESKGIIVHETLSQNSSANKYESKQSIVNKNLLQTYSADVDKLCSTEIEESFVPNFNVSIVFEGRKNIPDVSYEILYMATEGNA